VHSVLLRLRRVQHTCNHKDKTSSTVDTKTKKTQSGSRMSIKMAERKEIAIPVNDNSAQVTTKKEMYS